MSLNSGAEEPLIINLNADINGDPSEIDLDHSDKPIGFRLPFRLFCAGPSQSGKSRFVQRLVGEMDDWFDIRISDFYYLHPARELSSGSRQKFIQPLQDACVKMNVRFRNISGTEEQWFRDIELADEENHRLLVIDDMQEEITSSAKWADVFVRLSHQKLLSVILIDQTFFSGSDTGGKNSGFGRKIRRNCTDFVLFAGLKEQTHVNRIAGVVLGKNTDFIDKCFEWLNENVQNNFDRYILVDKNTASDPYLPRNFMKYFGVKTNIFKDPKTNQRLVIYFPCSFL